MSLENNIPVPVARPMLPPPHAVAPYIEEMHERGIFTNNGPLVQRLEARIAALVNVDSSRVVVANSGTQALESLVAVMEPRVWWVPDWTFTATGLAVLSAGKQLCIGDVDERSWRLDRYPSDLAEGAIVVAPFGGAVDTASLPPASTVIVDAAASLGGLEDLAGLGESHAVMFSLHATKVFGCGEGGVAICGSEHVARQVRSHINFGFAGERVSTIQSVNGKMSEIHAAYAHASLDNLVEESQEWSLAHSRAQTISDRLELNLGPTGLSTVHPYWIVDFETAERRAAVEEALTKEEIGFRQWWPVPLSQMPAFGGHPSAPNPVSAALSASVLGLPSFRGMPVEAFARIETTVSGALAQRLPA